MNKALFFILVLLAAGCSTGAKEDESADADSEAEESSEPAPPSHNVIKEYVNTPKNAAKGVANKVESRQNAAANQAKTIAGD